MRLARVVASIFALIGLSGAAQAADVPMSAPASMPIKAAAVMAVQHNWTGFYVGLFGGYHDGNITQSGCVGLCPVDPTLKGGLFGIQAGYDYQFSNNIVLGVFGLVPIVRPKGVTSIGPGLDFYTTPKFAWVAAGRLGYAFDRVLPYVFAGTSSVDVDVYSGVTNITASNRHSGPVYGFGVEYAVTRNISIDLRYLHMTSRNETYNFGGGNAEYGERSSNYLASVNYRF